VKLIENYKDGILEGLRKMFYDTPKWQKKASTKTANAWSDQMVYERRKPSMEHTYDNGNIQGPAKRI